MSGKFINCWREQLRDFRIKKWNAGLTRKLFPDQKYTVSFAFNVAGIDYFQFNSLENMPFERALMSLAIYEESKSKVTREYLEKHVEATNSILSEKTINIFDLKTLNDQLSERLQMITDVDILYKLASVVFFDANESPTLYDAEYCAKKIAHWKRAKSVVDFFLQIPCVELMPFINSFNFDLQTYSMLNEEMNNLHFARLSVLNYRNSLTDGSHGKKQSYRAVSN